ncbi:hypothetical protein J2S14_000617 [Lederbergia wuyishanensis]|uniref:Uncharacterized protein n=1 Tax=Lederbergia wuyishanensis TaxID=1347903 RepID=A0ABU0D0B2_9BACI|nr:hypothetical protein [Lederbergia wuyishanensis]
MSNLMPRRSVLIVGKLLLGSKNEHENLKKTIFLTIGGNVNGFH